MKPADARRVTREQACLVKGPPTRVQAARRADYRRWAAAEGARRAGMRWPL